MTGTSSLGTNYKKFIDKTMHSYERKVSSVRSLFNVRKVDSVMTDFEYIKLVQSYTEAEGYETFEDPEVMAEGTNARLEDVNTITDTSSPYKYGHAWAITDEMLSSNDETAKSLIASRALDAMISLENKINTSLISDMSANAGTSYSATATWSSVGDPVKDIISAKNTYMKRAGNIAPNFVLFNPDDIVDVAADDKFRNDLYGEDKTSKGMVNSIVGIPVMTDTAVTEGTFYMGTKGMFADYLDILPFKTFELEKGAAGKHYETVVKYATQFHKPYYLLKGTGI